MNKEEARKMMSNREDVKQKAMECTHKLENLLYVYKNQPYNMIKCSKLACNCVHCVTIEKLEDMIKFTKFMAVNNP